MKGRNPTFAAIINFIIPGLGYLYARKRELFGWMILLATITSTIYSYDKPELFYQPMFILSSLIISFAFSYDVYRELKPRKRKK
jgi:hypothetical protein|tara:strand:- start:248 stop:499 length:252 start_codon:yes stop_codon:yes gene_type:complete